MLRGYSFLIAVLLAFTGLAWWSHHLGFASLTASQAPDAPSGASLADLSDPEQDPAQVSANRREVLEALDRIVAYERYYHSVYGHFTKFLNRIGYTLPKSVSDVYEVRVAEASQTALVATAVSESKGRTGDVISIDQDYHLNSSFSLPEPRLEYLRANAMRQLRLMLAETEASPTANERGIFTGYFRFLSRGEGDDRNVVAVGIRPPVQGLQLELNARSPHQEVTEDLAVGQKQQNNVATSLEEARLAQTIFRGEVGRYAKSWDELSKIADFKFDDKERDDELPFGDPALVPVQEIDAHEPQAREPAALGKLIIEPIN
jgi:hypothetical protein